MEFVLFVLKILIHLDQYLESIIIHFGFKTYILIFIIIFFGSAFILTPFLPGNSLLFISGTMAAIGILNIYILVLVLITSASVGGFVNFNIGKFFGRKIIDSKWGKYLIKKSYLEKTRDYYENSGGRTMIACKFVPVVRTFSPFIAAIGGMRYSKFSFYNIIGSIVWITTITMIGYLFGNIEVVRNNYSATVIGLIIVYSILAIINAVKKGKKYLKRENKY